MTKPNNKATQQRKPINWGERRARISEALNQRGPMRPDKVAERNDDIRRVQEILNEMDPAEKDILWSVHVEGAPRCGHGDQSRSTACRKTASAEQKFRTLWGEG